MSDFNEAMGKWRDSIVRLTMAKAEESGAYGNVVRARDAILSPPPAASTPVASEDPRRVVVDLQGVSFGANCWIAHDRIVGLHGEATPAQRGAFYRDRVLAREYVKWMNAMLDVDRSKPTPAATTAEEDLERERDERIALELLDKAAFDLGVAVETMRSTLAARKDRGA